MERKVYYTLHFPTTSGPSSSFRGAAHGIKNFARDKTIRGQYWFYTSEKQTNRTSAEMANQTVL